MPLKHSAAEILNILDRCAEAYTFPMLDNGYVYLAATRLTLFRSDDDWALTTEVFGFSPRSGLPDTNIGTFASTLTHRRSASDFVSTDAHQDYLANNPHNESAFAYPIDEGDWIDSEDGEQVASNAKEVVIRGQHVDLPRAKDFPEFGISLEDPPNVAVFELCRALAVSHRGRLLATEAELRQHLLPEMRELLHLDEWHHPDLVNDERPSGTAAFQQLAEVLVTGDAARYTPSEAPNTHWSNWPDGGTL